VTPLPVDTVASQDPLLAACEGRVVTSVDVDTRRPRFRGPMAIWRRVARSIGLHNTETRESVIRRYLTLEPGEPCTEFRRAESERLLRAQPYLATASVRTHADGFGRVRVAVETVDEVPALVAARYRARNWALGFGNENIFGTGTRVMLRTERRSGYREGYSAVTEFRQVFGKPYVLGLEATRNPLGERYVFDFSHAFLTDLQRFAWHAGAMHRQDYVRLRYDADDATLTLPLDQTTWATGSIVRFGRPGRTFLAGGVLTNERVTPAERTVLVTDEGFADPVPADMTAGAQYRPVHSVRVNAVGGYRNLRYRAVRGHDALTGEQDRANGVQLGLTVGRSIPRLGGDDDGFVATHLFGGIGSQRSYAALQVDAEARRSFADGEDWDGILGSGRAAWYFKPSRVITSIASIEYAAGWRSRFPYLLELGDREGGVLGFGGADMAGARRGVVRLEERWIAGPVAGRGDLGFALFGEAGRLWAGDAPYGMSTSTAASVGLSVMAAVPVGGQRLYRVDVGFPVRGPGPRGAEVRISSGDPTRAFWETPDDIMRARAAAIPQHIFGWP
jgi:hypothetical protein